MQSKLYFPKMEAILMAILYYFKCFNVVNLIYYCVSETPNLLLDTKTYYARFNMMEVVADNMKWQPS